MKLFRNPEIRKEILYYIVIYLAGAAWAFWQFDSVAAGMVVLAGTVALILHLGLIGKRYKRIADMSEKWTVYCMMMGRRCCRIVRRESLRFFIHSSTSWYDV